LRWARRRSGCPTGREEIDISRPDVMGRSCQVCGVTGQGTEIGMAGRVSALRRAAERLAAIGVGIRYGNSRTECIILGGLIPRHVRADERGRPETGRSRRLRQHRHPAVAPDGKRQNKDEQASQHDRVIARPSAPPELTFPSNGRERAVTSYQVNLSNAPATKIGLESITSLVPHRADRWRPPCGRHRSGTMCRHPRLSPSKIRRRRHRA